MDYNEFTKRKDAYNEFVEMRKVVLESAQNKKVFNEVFAELCTKAYMGDCVAQDCVAYFFNKGIPDRLTINYNFYLGWEILAGANGNEFALEKLEFFLNAALEQIIDDTELLTIAMQKRNINKNNALMVISNLLCEGIVDQLQLKPSELIDLQAKAVLYSPEVNRRYLDALDKCITKVAEFLVS